MDARPTKNETDEDLLAQQEEFLKKLTQKIINPSSRLVKPDRPCKFFCLKYKNSD